MSDEELLKLHIWIKEHNVVMVESTFGHDGGGVRSWTQVLLTDIDGEIYAVEDWPFLERDIHFSPGQLGCLTSSSRAAEDIIRKRDENKHYVEEREEVLARLAQLNEHIGDVPI